MTESERGKAALELQHELVRTRYLAYLGWGSRRSSAWRWSVAFFYYKPPLEAVPEPEPDEGERPTHRIV